MYWGILQKQDESLVSLQEVEESQVERHLGRTSGHEVPGNGLDGGGLDGFPPGGPAGVVSGEEGFEAGYDSAGGD
jgi:hypothetical protein